MEISNSNMNLTAIFYFLRVAFKFSRYLLSLYKETLEVLVFLKSIFENQTLVLSSWSTSNLVFTDLLGEGIMALKH